MRIVFSRIEIHNFMSFSDDVFEFDKHEGLNLICGKNNDVQGAKNGCGKSQLFESLLFSLYGQTRNNIRNVYIHNRFVEGKDVRVVTFFSVEKHSYKIASGFNKYGAPYCEFSEIVENDEIDLTKSTIAETRKFVEQEILHCDISIFLRTILLTSDQNYNFFRLRKGEKKEFIEKLFDISIFGDMYDFIHHDILNSDKEILAHQNKLLVLNKTYDEYKDRICKYNEDLSKKTKQLEEKLAELKEKHSKLKNLSIKSNAEEVKKYEAAIDIIDNAINDASAKIRKLNSENSKIEVAIHKLNSSKDQKQKVVDKHSELLDKLCNDCKKIFSDYYNIDTYIVDIKNSIESINKHNSQIEANSKIIDVQNNKISALQIKKDKANDKIRHLSEEYNKTTREIQSIETSMMITESELSKAQSDVNPYVDLLNSSKADIDKESKSLDEISESYTYMKMAESIVSQDTLRKFIIADLIGLLNNKIKMYLTKFGAKYNVVFDSDMDYEFITDGGTCEYDNFSAGERARLMIAACFAFRDFMYIRNNLSSNILILDEFIDGAIDSLAIESILDILKGFSDVWKQNIFVISHRKEINNDVFNNIIQIVKTDNIAKITYLD